MKNLENIRGKGDVAAVGVDEPDGGQVDEVISQSREKEQAGRNTIQHRIAKCRERQGFLVNKTRNLQQRINSLRAQKVGQHAAEQIQTAVVSCDKRLARHPLGGRGEQTRDQKLVHSEEDKANPKEAEPKIRRAKVRKFNKSKADETFGQLQASLRQIQTFIDPEATESSSGGESCDEQERFPAGATLYAPIQERAKYRWQKKRSEHAAQWGWLQCQISDIEFRIRQNTELYRVYREAKGGVVLGEPPVLASPLKAGKYLGSAHGPDGIQRRPVEFDYSSEDTEGREEDDTSTCARVRPVVRVKRRKLIDTYGLHTSAKASKPSTISCSCLHPEEWCVLCLGRRNHKQKLDPFNQSREETVALLDHSYHVVLSSRNEVPLSLALSEGVKNKKWVNLPSMTRNTAIPSHLSKLMDINDRAKLEAERRARLEAKRTIAMRRKEEGKSARKKARLDSGKQEIRDAKELHRIRDTSTLQEQVKRKRKNSYDIDHVVIPFNLNAPRVEKPKYKEIQTPSWREVDKPYPWPPPGSTKKSLIRKPEPPKPSSKDPDFEDISDLIMATLHAKAEEEERIRWATPLGRVHGGQRQRANRSRRLDSCMTEASSGACTPDPLSPGLVENIVVQTRPSSPQDDRPFSPVLFSTTPTTTTGPHSSAGSTPNPMSSADSTFGLIPSTGSTPSSESTPGPMPSADSTPGPMPIADSTPGPMPSADSTPGSTPSADSTPGPMPSADSTPGSTPCIEPTPASTTSLLHIAGPGIGSQPIINPAPSPPVGPNTGDNPVHISDDQTPGPQYMTDPTSGHSPDSIHFSTGSFPGQPNSETTTESQSSTGTTPDSQPGAAGPQSSTFPNAGTPAGPTPVNTQHHPPGSSRGPAATITHSVSVCERTVSSAPSGNLVVQSPSAATGQSSRSGFSCVTPVPASVINRRRTSSVTKSRDRNLSEASQHSQESSRSTSPWTEIVEILPYEMRQFPLTDEEMKELEDEDSKMRPPPPPSKTPSAATSRTTSRSSSLEDGADPDWDEENNDDDDEEEDEEEEEEDPEYRPSNPVRIDTE